MRDPAEQALTELLVLRAQAGYSDALSLLVREWQGRLTRHAQRLTKDQEAGSDVVQDAWMDIARGLWSLDDPARFGPWAYQIVTRRCALWVRKQQRRRRHEQPADVVDANVSALIAHREVRRRADTIDDLRSALRRLSAEDQTLLELRYLHEFSVDDIAMSLDIRSGTVKSRLFHARQRLKQELQR